MVKKWDCNLNTDIPYVVIEYEEKRRKLTANSKPKNEIERKVVKALRDYEEDMIHYGPGRGFSWVRMGTFFELCDILGSDKLIRD